MKKLESLDANAAANNVAKKAKRHAEHKRLIDENPELAREHIPRDELNSSITISLHRAGNFKDFPTKSIVET